jgi:hypothetical protein
MKRTPILATLFVAAIITPAQTPKAKGILLENLTWVEAEKVLTRDTVVVIPIGAASKEHGPHLKHLVHGPGFGRYEESGEGLSPVR